MLVVYLSLTGNTRRFIEKLNMKSLELNQMNPRVAIEEDFVLIIPTYSDTVTDIICDFIDHQDNLKHLKGVVGGGEKNFGRRYIFSAKDVSKEYNIPLIFDFEKSGNSTDVENFKKEVDKLAVTN